jgi:hypothetical protein
MTRMIRTTYVATALAGLALATGVSAQQTTAPTPAPHHAMANQVMGFDQDKTTHHFYLYDDGGAIDVSVKDKADTANRDAIRSHLPHIAMMFGQGNFEAPMMVHDTAHVPGIEELAKFKDKVKWAYTETATGGRVDVVTTDKDALAAVHAFMKFQIKDHATGDKTSVAKRKS